MKQNNIWEHFKNGKVILIINSIIMISMRETQMINNLTNIANLFLEKIIQDKPHSPF